MKNRLLQILIMSLKFSCYIFIIQVVFMTSLIASSANAQYKSVKEVYINADFDNATVANVFKYIEAQTDLKFHYFQKHIRKNAKLTFTDDKVTVAEVLYKVSDMADIKFLQLNNNIAVSTMRRPSENNLAVVEAISIQGIVSDDTGVGLPGVNVVVKGTTQGTITDATGAYSLDVSEGATLIFSFIGFKTQEIEVGTRNTIDVEMTTDFETLSEVIVTAYGTSTKKSFTGSAVQINAEALEGRAITNVTSALQGVPGVQFSSTDGQPGASTTVQIRGIGSINTTTSPLYVVDGVPFTGSLSSINPQDIESISVLKDAASTSLYGSRAANGVVILTTKTGKNGQSKFNVNFSQGTSSRGIKEYERISAEQYYPIMWEALRNANAIPGTATAAELDAANQDASDNIFDQLETNPFNVPNDEIVLTDGTLNPQARLLYPDDLDWQKPLEKSGSRTSFDMSYQGGTEKSSHFFSLSALEDTGWAINSDFKRISGRVNMSAQPKKWLKTGFNLSATSSKSNQSNDGGSASTVNPFAGTRRVAPIYSVFEHDPVTGDFILDGNGDKVYDLGDNRVGVMVGRHAILENLLGVDIDRIFTVSGKGFVAFNFLNDFKFTANASLDNRHFSTEDFDSNIVGDGSPLGRAGRVSANRTSISFNQLLNYDKDFDQHSIGVLLGHESLDYKDFRLAGNRRALIAEGNTELGNFAEITNLDSRTRTLTSEGYFARIEYDYSDKYFLSTSFRSDGSSRFNEDVRWGQFWSVGTAWRLDQESFIKNISLVNILKLRASYGEVGNDGAFDHTTFSFYASQSLFALGNNNDTEPGILLNQLAAPQLEWETNAQSDVAIEFSLLDFRLSGTVEYYNRKTSGLLFNVPLPVSSGVDDVNQNIGDMSNSGLEISLSGEVLKTQDFSWNLDISASTIKNEITKLPQDSIINGTKQYVKGGSIYSYWLREWAGVDPADGSALYVVDPETDPTDGDIREVNGRLVTTDANDANFAFVGTAIPDLFGNITSSFRYKNFNLGFLFIYKIGGKTYDTNYSALISSGGYGIAKHVDILDRWQQPGDVTNVPRLDASETANFNAGSSRFLVSSSYIGLRQITLSYDLPSKITDVAGLESARVFANAENLWNNTARQGLEIQQNFNGTTQNRFTPARIFTMGINVTF